MKKKEKTKRKVGWDLIPLFPEAVVRRCSVKRCSWKFHKIYRKTPMPESLFY